MGAAYQNRSNYYRNERPQAPSYGGQQAMSNELVTYATDSGAEIKLSPQIVKQYLVNGAGNVSDQEVMMFLNLCRYQKLNPFLREAYLIKYGNSPAQIVTGKECFTRRAERHPDFKGYEAGVYCYNENGELIERKGTFALPGERIIGGWAKVHRQGYNVPIEYSVSFEEYAAKKNDGTLNNQWATKPGTMIRKCALVAALREAFPSELQGMYDRDEINTLDVSQLPESPVNVPTEIYNDEPMQHPGAVDYVEPTAAKMGGSRQPDLTAPQQISADQAKNLFVISNKNQQIVRAALDEYGYKNSTDVLDVHYDEICDMIANASSQ